jgi:transcriptional regulator with XRE-family HTH domain
MKNNLRFYRERNKGTIKQACVFFGVDKSVITRWETGVNLPQLKSLGKFERFYCEKVQDLWPEVFE